MSRYPSPAAPFHYPRAWARYLGRTKTKRMQWEAAAVMLLYLLSIAALVIAGSYA